MFLFTDVPSLRGAFLVDTVDKKTRSRYMSAVKSRGNQTTETKIMCLLKEHRIKGWRRHYTVVGTPDFCWPDIKVALFVDGCFWHGCPRCYKTPKSNVAYWKAKIVANRKRDRRVVASLRTKGWKVVRVWEFRIMDKRTITRIIKATKGKAKITSIHRNTHS
jgi:DNA mismatch endonuclease (patch repair protein)